MSFSPPRTVPERVDQTARWRSAAVSPPAVAASLMAIVGLWRLGRPALWADELATIGAATLSWSDLVMLVRHVDMVIAPYYVVMHLWIGLVGDSAVAVRLPSVAAMVVSAALTSDIARRLHGPRAGYLAALIFVVVPHTSRFAQEARAYSLGIMFVTLATWIIVRRWGSPNVRTDVAAALMVAFAGLMQPAFLLALPGLLAFRLRDSNRWVRWLVLSCLAAVPGTATFLYSSTHNAAVWDWIQVIPWTDAPYRAGSVFGTREGGGALLVLACVSLRARCTELATAALGILPIGALLAVGMLQPVFTGRLLVFTIPALAILIAGMLSRTSRLGTFGCLAALLVICLPAHSAIRADDGHGQASAAIASIIGPRYEPGDVAVYGELPRSIAWSPRDLVTYYLPKNRTPDDVLALSPQRAAGQFLAKECLDVPRCLGTPRRVWIIRADSPRDPLSGMGAKSTYLSKHYRVTATFRESELTVALLLLTAPA